MRDWLSGIGALFVAVGLIVAVTVGYYAVLPWFYGRQFQAVRQSNPFVTTQQTSLVQFYSSYQGLEVKKQGASPETLAALEGQQKAIVLQMRQQASLIAPENVPLEIREFLRTH